jgi:ribose transport system ATP-binding protein
MRHDPGPRRDAAAADGGGTVAALERIRVAYGPTLAVDGLSLGIRAGEVLGLVGANGAGKSTLMRVLSGATEPDDGRVLIAGQEVDLGRYTPHAAHVAGVRIVWQELSLCPNLTVAENFYIEQPRRERGLRWRARYRDLARSGLDDVFPQSGVPPDRGVGMLPIGQRQMVEIARAAAAPGLRLLILDEPTSSLDAMRSRQLRAHVRDRAAEGIAVIFISHKLGEVLDVADRVFVMRNGREILDAPGAEVKERDLVQAMGGGVGPGERPTRRRTESGEELARLGGELTASLGADVTLVAGEIVGLAGLEGDGQKPLLERLFRARAGDKDVVRRAPAAYVAGDRAAEGIFPLWPVASNVSIGRVAQRSGLAWISPAAETAASGRHAAAIDLDVGRLGSNILELSGGNQQKALAARALATDARILILEDPTRGVDIATKRRFYDLARDCADAGKLVIWHTTEDAEFAECDRVLVMAGGRITAELRGADIAEERVLSLAFAGREAHTADTGRRTVGGLRLARLALGNAAILGLVLVLAALVALNPLVASAFGLDLLLGPAVALTLIALAQMFVVGGSEIDLGVGAFAGLVNVVSATLLVTAPILGLGALVAGLGGYALMALLIRLRGVPAIVVTLGASFIWYGIGYSLQPAPGGAAPEWLRATTQWSLPGLPTPLVLIAVAALAALAIHRSRLGTVLRGFGANALALGRSGWSPVRYGVIRYLVAGAFAAAGGLTITATSGASDINAGSGYTLLAVAAVVLGGCRLIGGVISPVGVVAGAVTLSLIGALLGALGVSTDFNAAVQGLVMLGVLVLRAAVDRGGDA